MRLKVIGSSSEGNGYVLDNGKESLVIEAGVPYTETLREVNYMNNRIVGCIVSHEHGDHASFVTQYIRNNISVFGSNPMHEDNPRVIPFTGEQFSLGGFRIKPFRVYHDVECWGFIINHKETGNILFVTDSKGLDGYTLPKLDYVLIECNYMPSLLDKNVDLGIVPETYRRRVSETHMSVDECIEVLSNNNISSVKHIVLLHGSKNNGNSVEFEDAVSRATGKKTITAKPHLNLAIDKIPF